YDAVETTLASLHGACPGTVHRWRPATAVVGARVRFQRRAARISAGEEVRAEVAAVPVAVDRARIADAIAGRSASVVGKSARLVGPGTTTVLGVGSALPAGRYVPVVLLRATMNSARKQVFVGARFAVR